MKRVLLIYINTSQYHICAGKNRAESVITQITSILPLQFEYTFSAIQDFKCNLNFLQSTKRLQGMKIVLVLKRDMASQKYLG